MIPMSVRIHVEMPDREVRTFLGQDPMGELDKPVRVAINGQRIYAVVDSYVSTNGHAKIVLSGETENGS